MHVGKEHRGIWAAMIPALYAAALAASTMAQSVSPHHQFLGGPWEVLVKLGLEGTGVRIPVSVADENKPESIGTVTPVMGTPIKVKLERYLPDVKRETVPVADPNGGPVAKLSLRGENLQQDIWLAARDRERQSVSAASIGSVAIRELPGSADASILQELTEPEVVGVLLVWLSETSPPLAYTVRPGKVITLPGSPWRLSITRYVPHYSIDRQTKKVTSQSDRPENPAIEIRAQTDNQDIRQWLWSQFAMSPHKTQQLPFRVRFLDFQVSAAASRYLLVVSPGPKSHLLYLKQGRKHIEPAEMSRQHPFDDKRYSFAIEEVRLDARLETTWQNNSEMLLHPAIVATITQGAAEEQVLLELGQPFHHRTAAGTLVMLYRHVPDAVK
jgi:hypothetical protein